MLKHKIRTTLAALLVTFLVITPMTAFAQTSGSVSDTIIYGLWQGVNLRVSSTTTDENNSSQNGNKTGTKTNKRTGAYFALGDSVAAGVGLPGSVATSSAEERCGRTGGSYAFRVSHQVDLPMTLKACSGATTRDFYTRDWEPSPSLPSQIDSAFAKGTPSLITMTTGANDIRWAGFLQNCYESNCATESNTIAVKGGIVIVKERLENVMDEISRRSGDNPPVVVLTGYYNPVSARCSSIEPRATPQEIAWIGARVNDLNRHIREVADAYSFVHYAPVNFTGHDVCSTDSWVQGRNDPQPFHPTTEGQRAIAQSILLTLRNN